MSQWDKLLGKITSMSKEVRFDELRKILEAYGYTMYSPRGGSSHYTFRKPGEPPITVPKHEPIKPAYVKMVKEIIERTGRDENS